MHGHITFYLAAFALCVAFCEAAIWLFARNRYWAQAALASLLAVLLSAALLWVESQSLAFGQRPFAFAAVVAWVLVVPVVLSSVISLVIVKRLRAAWRHFGVAVFSAALVGVYPQFALLSVCLSGVDCI